MAFFNLRTFGNVTDGLARDFGGISMEERMLMCAICKEYYEEPRLLPCSHTFCTQCLVNLRNSGSIKCPECRADCSTPVNELPINQAVKTLAAEKKKHQQRLSHLFASPTRPESASTEFRVNILDLHGKNHIIQKVTLQTTVGQLKAKFCDKTGVPIQEQRLIFKGKPLEDDDKEVGFYKVEKNCTIHLVLRQIGGNFAYTLLIGA